VRALCDARVPLGGLDALDRLLGLSWWVKATVEERRVSPLWTPPAHQGSKPAAPIFLVIRNAAARSGDPWAPALQSALRGKRGSLVLVDADGATSSMESESPRGWPRDLRLIPYLDHRATRASASESLDRCLDFWQGILSFGCSPARVSLIVFDGYATASTELAIAMALGARVALIGAAAQSLWAQPLWRDGWGETAGRSRGAPLQAIVETPRAMRDFIAGSR
jgi:hypothetical protein